MVKRKITAEDIFMHRPITTATNFPDMWIYFMHHVPCRTGDIENHNVWAAVQVRYGQEKWKQGRDNQGYNDYEVWAKGGDASGMNQFYYLAERDSLLFMDDLSTPKREKVYKTEEEMEAALEHEEPMVANYVRDLIVKLENDAIDRDALNWVYGQWCPNSKKDLYNYWERMQTAMRIETASNMLYGTPIHVLITLKNIPEAEALERMAEESYALAEALRKKGFDPDYDEKIKVKYQREMDTARAALDADPANKKLQLIYEVSKSSYDRACGKGYFDDY